MTPKPSMGLFCVCSPDGDLVFTCVSTTEKDSIETWLHQETVTIELANMARAFRKQKPICCPSWEQFESEGYSVVPVVLLPATIEPKQDRVSK